MAQRETARRVRALGAQAAGWGDQETAKERIRKEIRSSGVGDVVYRAGAPGVMT